MADVRQTMSSLVEEFDHRGTVMAPMGVLFSDSEIEDLNSLQEKLPEEYVRLGDAGEPNDLYVRRIMVDHPGKEPERVNLPISNQVLDILDREDKHLMFSHFIKRRGYIRRCQVNRMVAGSFIGLHLDTDSNPDYLVSIVIQLGKDFKGGEFVTHRSDGENNAYAPTFGSVIISDCAIRHEVKKVVENERTSLVYFYSFNSGVNRNQL